MTREEARKAAEVMMAYADGKKVEYSIKGDNNSWCMASAPAFNWDSTKYRIKKEPTYRPFKDKEECWNEMMKHQPFGWIYEKLSTAYININGLDNVCICGYADVYEYNKAFEQFTFADGTQFGIKEE